MLGNLWHKHQISIQDSLPFGPLIAVSGLPECRLSSRPLTAFVLMCPIPPNSENWVLISRSAMKEKKTYRYKVVVSFKFLVLIGCVQISSTVICCMFSYCLLCVDICLTFWSTDRFILSFWLWSSALVGALKEHERNIGLIWSEVPWKNFKQWMSYLLQITPERPQVREILFRFNKTKKLMASLNTAKQYFICLLNYLYCMIIFIKLCLFATGHNSSSL